MSPSKSQAVKDAIELVLKAFGKAVHEHDGLDCTQWIPMHPLFQYIQQENEDNDIQRGYDWIKPTNFTGDLKKATAERWQYESGTGFVLNESDFKIHVNESFFYEHASGPRKRGSVPWIFVGSTAGSSIRVPDIRDVDARLYPDEDNWQIYVNVLSTVLSENSAKLCELGNIMKERRAKWKSTKQKTRTNREKQTEALSMYEVHQDTIRKLQEENKGLKNQQSKEREESENSLDPYIEELEQNLEKQKEKLQNMAEEIVELRRGANRSAQKAERQKSVIKKAQQQTRRARSKVDKLETQLRSFKCLTDEKKTASVTASILQDINQNEITCVETAHKEMLSLLDALLDKLPQIPFTTDGKWNSTVYGDVDDLFAFYTVIADQLRAQDREKTGTKRQMRWSETSLKYFLTIANRVGLEALNSTGLVLKRPSQSTIKRYRASAADVPEGPLVKEFAQLLELKCGTEGGKIV